MTHDDLMKEIRAYAESLGLVVEHFPNAHGCWVKGFPDLFIVGPNSVAWREVKGSNARLDAAQWEWSWCLLKAGQSWGVWRPSEWPDHIKHELDQLAKV